MSEQKKHNKIEDAIIELLDGELQENALKFAAYLNENQLTPNMSAWGKFIYNGYNLGHMWIEDNNWLFEIFDYLHFGDFTDGDEEFKKAIYDHVNICGSPCHDECWRVKDVFIIRFTLEKRNKCTQGHFKGVYTLSFGFYVLFIIIYCFRRSGLVWYNVKS